MADDGARGDPEQCQPPAAPLDAGFIAAARSHIVQLVVTHLDGGDAGAALGKVISQGDACP